MSVLIVAEYTCRNIPAIIQDTKKITTVGRSGWSVLKTERVSDSPSRVLARSLGSGEDSGRIVGG
jgi:hypothetical protein